MKPKPHKSRTVRVTRETFLTIVTPNGRFVLDIYKDGGIVVLTPKPLIPSTCTSTCYHLRPEAA